MKDLRSWTEPTPEEVERLVATPLVDPRWVDATTPTDEEVAKLLARARPRRAPVAPAWSAGVGLIAVAAGLFLALRATPAPNAVYAPVGQVVDVVDVLKLDATWTVSGSARLRVARAVGGELEVELDQGHAEFVAAGPAAPLRVSAQQTRVGAEQGTFALDVVGDRVDLAVASGVVQLLGPGRGEVRPGGRWSWPPARSSAPPSDAGPRTVQPTVPVRGVPAVAPVVVAPVVEAPPVDPVVEMGEILSRREAGDSAATLAPLVDTWLREHPDHPLASEMGWLALELAVDTTAPALALEEVDRWIRTHPDDPRRVDAWWLRATIAEERLHDCSRALDAYRWLVINAPVAQRPEAAARLEACSRPDEPR